MLFPANPSVIASLAELREVHMAHRRAVEERQRRAREGERRRRAELAASRLAELQRERDKAERQQAAQRQLEALQAELAAQQRRLADQRAHMAATEQQAPQCAPLFNALAPRLSPWEGLTTFSFWRLALQQRVLIGVSISGVLCALLLLIWALQVRAQSSEVEQQVARSAAELQALREETAQAARAYQDRIRTLTAEKMATAAALRQALAARAERSSMAPATTSDRSRTRPPRRAPEARKAAPRAQRSAARKRVRIPIFDADDPLAGV